MSWSKPEQIKGGVLDGITGDVRECLRAYIQGDLDHLAGCIRCQEGFREASEYARLAFQKLRAAYPRWPVEKATQREQQLRAAYPPEDGDKRTA